MKLFVRCKHAPFIILSAVLLLVGCSKSSDGSSTSIIQEIIKPKGLRIGMEYQQRYNEHKGVYIFGKDGVSVYGVIDDRGDVYRNTVDGSLMLAGGSVTAGFMQVPLPGGNPQGTRFQMVWEVVFGPGDRMPELENAAYTVEGASVYVDWSQHHSKYFGVSGCDSGSEVWNIKNDGLVLESATSPGNILTFNMTAPADSVQNILNNQANQLRKQNVGPINP